MRHCSGLVFCEDTHVKGVISPWLGFLSRQRILIVRVGFLQGSYFAYFQFAWLQPGSCIDVNPLSAMAVSFPAQRSRSCFDVLAWVSIIYGRIGASNHYQPQQESDF